MSRVATLLFAVLFATVANATYPWHTSGTFSEVVQRTTNSAIMMVERQIEEIHKNIEREFEKFHYETYVFANEYSQQIIEFQEKASSQIGEIIRHSPNNSECWKVPAAHWEGKTAQTVMSKTTECLIRKLQPGLLNLDHIHTIHEKGLTRIAEIRAETEHCGDEDKLKFDRESFLATMTCPETVAVKAFEVSVTIVPVLKTLMNRIRPWWETVQPTLGECLENNGFDALKEETIRFIENTRKCVEQEVGPLDITREYK